MKKVSTVAVRQTKNCSHGRPLQHLSQSRAGRVVAVASTPHGRQFRPSKPSPEQMPGRGTLSQARGRGPVGCIVAVLAGMHRSPRLARGKALRGESLASPGTPLPQDDTWWGRMGCEAAAAGVGGALRSFAPLDGSETRPHARQAHAGREHRAAGRTLAISAKCMDPSLGVLGFAKDSAASG
jgi:hypothetical protein